MALERPPLSYARIEKESVEEKLALALRLASGIEELLEETPSSPFMASDSKSAHSTRIARAMAASLVDELQALVRGVTSKRKSGVA